MKKIISVLFIVFVSLSFAQKKEKIKGSKIVTVQKKQIENFESIEVYDNLEIFLVKGNECGVEIEADDNLHEAIQFTISGTNLRISTLKDITGAKKLSLRITYTDNFKMVTARNETVISALQDVELDSIIFRGFDKTKLYINAKSKNFDVELDDKSSAELNLKADNSKISLQKSSNLKALIAANNLIVDLYQKSDATIEGDVDALKVRLDNNSNYVGKNLVSKNASITAEGYTTAIINCKLALTLYATGKSQIQIYGDPTFDLKQFSDSAILLKKPSR